MYCYIDRLKWSFLPGLDTYELHWFQNETIVNLRECTDSLIRNYVPGFTYLALNPSFYFGEQPYTYKARHAHKRLYTVLPKYSKIQVLPGITSCRLVKDNKQAIELNSLLINNMPKGGYG